MFLTRTFDVNRLVYTADITEQGRTSSQSVHFRAGVCKVQSYKKKQTSLASNRWQSLQPLIITIWTLYCFLALLCGFVKIALHHWHKMHFFILKILKFRYFSSNNLTYVQAEELRRFIWLFYGILSKLIVSKQ